MILLCVGTPKAHCLLKNGAIAKPYTGDMREQEILENFILSQGAGETHYLCSEIATYILLEIGVYSAKINIVIQTPPP